MTPDAREYLRRHLLVDEGLRQFPYKDTVGKLTVGIGRNLSDVGISPDEAFYLMENDIDRTWNALVAKFPWVLRLDPVRQVVLVNMAYQMGVVGLAKFVNTLGAVQRGAYSTAANGMRRSLWYRQTQKTRTERLIRMMTSGMWPDEQGD